MNAAPLQESARHFWDSWGLLLVAAVGAAAILITVMVLLAHPED